MATIRSLRIMMYVDHKGVKKGLNTVSKMVKGTAMGMAATIAAVFLKVGVAKKIAKNIRFAMDRAMKEQRFRIELASLSGIGNQLFNQLRELSMRSPFSIDEWVGGSKRLLSSGVAAEKVAETMEMLGEMSAATGSTVKDLALIYGQVFAKGRLQGEEVLQFMERGISLNAALQKTLGKSARELQEMQEKGLITPDMMTDAMRFMTSPEGIFGGMMDALLMTAEGMLIALKNIWDATLADFGKSVLPVFTALIKGIAMIAQKGGVITGFMDQAAMVANLILIPITGIVWAMGLAQESSLRILGYLIGALTFWAVTATTIVFIKNQMWLMTILTNLWLKTLIAARKVWKGIAALSMTTGGWLKLLAMAVTFVAVIFGMTKIIKAAVDSMADKFNKMQQSSGEIGRNMTLSNQLPSGALFGTVEEYKILMGGRRREIQAQMLAELKRIRELMWAEKNGFTKEEKETEYKKAKGYERFGFTQ